MMYFTDYREMNNFSLDERNSVAAKINFQLTPYLYRIGLSPHIAGYFYLRDAVAEYLLAPGASFSVTKDIYPRIAEKYNKTTNAIERSIRHAITCAWKAGGLRGLKNDENSFFLTFREKPSNKRFILSLVEMMRFSDEQRARQEADKKMSSRVTNWNSPLDGRRNHSTFTL